MKLRHPLLAVALVAVAGLGAQTLWTLTGRTLIAHAQAGGAPRAEAAARRVRPVLERDLARAGLRYGAPVFLRIFKAERELELWVDDGARFRLFRTYPVCTFSGTLGPKLRQGDGQAPEGFYRVRAGQLNPWSSYHLSFDLGYPNAYDRAHGRTGSLLMVHGSCVSIGCYAMGDAQIEEIFTLVSAALSAGQAAVDVHALPFRFDGAYAARLEDPQWGEFWRELKAGADAFARDGRPPRIRVEARRYVVAPPP